MGAYLYEVEPPFAITHISHEPIIPRIFYDEHTDGWSFRAIDYIVFPMNIVVDGDNLLVSVGRNDRSGWVVRLDIKGLVRSLLPVNSTVLKDRFFEHMTYSHNLV